jgi:hypothetical protein
MRQAIQAGVSAYIVEGIHAARLQPILDVAMARFESDQALKAQLLARDQQLAERKRIEQAKGLLMKMKDCNEEAGLHPDAPPGHEPPAEADPGGRADHCHVGDAGLMPAVISRR